VIQTANCSTDNRRSSRTWKITAHFSPSVHIPIYDSSLQYSQQYIRDDLNSRLQHMQKTENNMHSITLLSFAYPRQFRAHAEVLVIVNMHFLQLVSFPTIHALLGRGTTGVNASCSDASSLFTLHCRLQQDPHRFAPRALALLTPVTRMDSGRIYRRRPGFPGVAGRSSPAPVGGGSSPAVPVASTARPVGPERCRATATANLNTNVPHLACNEMNMTVAEVSAGWLGQGTEEEHS
jgi:hypothetical protein